MTREGSDEAPSEDRPPTAAEIEAWHREDLFLPPGDADEATYPSLYNISAGMIFTGVIRPLQPQLPDYVAIPLDRPTDELAVKVANWNMLWEAGQFRRRFFDADELPEPMAKVADLGDVNVILVPRTRSRYYEYAPLFHLLPKDVLDRFDLPLMRRGQWPFLADWRSVDRFLPADFAQSLSRAWAATVWPLLNSGSRLSAFSADDPIRLLAHNLDFWLPPVTTVIQELLGEFPLVDKGKPVGPVPLADGGVLPDAVTGNPRMGGTVWAGVQGAGEVVAATVEAADATGRLRDILDAVRAHRVADDFSPSWSFAREDFERKLYRKRNKVAVRFVELTDSIPVQSPDSDVLGNLVTRDFLALLDEKKRQIVILLASGFRQHEIAEQLGYANHSPVSKRLEQIRRQAEAFFGLDG
ncbi:hypothetical protein SAMN05660209_03293 [Geodermatophilus africanus]|uniref:Uncharacterized protein n=1 Tax=Geodermatophilus africanus TaxID=1137993 RepID=A0A1H3LD09_9ACTN|nr:hypothetical protein [Geodermatophilus africanus]SDY62292.1 hypothetical protein SAMN05660209_03293 [Geodermatophilus africanus]